MNPELNGKALGEFLQNAEEGNANEARENLNAYLASLPAQAWKEHITQVNRLLHAGDTKSGSPSLNLLVSDGFDQQGNLTNQLHIELNRTNKNHDQVDLLFSETLDQRKREVLKAEFKSDNPSPSTTPRKLHLEPFKI